MIEMLLFRPPEAESALDWLHVPLLVCDFCSKPIMKAKEGIMVYDNRQFEKSGDRITTAMIHRACETGTSQRTLHWVSLETMMEQLNHNIQLEGD